MATTAAPLPAAESPVYRFKLPFVIAASAAGTVIEWYDFYLYGVLAAFFATQFFPPGNDVAALLASLATFGAGFAVRPFGAAVFGRIGDIIGRKYTFLVTITMMGGATALVGVLPTYAQIGILAPIILVTAPPRAGSRPRWRVRRRRDLRRRTRAGPRSAASTRAGSRPRRPSGCCSRSR